MGPPSAPPPPCSKCRGCNCGATDGQLADRQPAAATAAAFFVFGSLLACECCRDAGDKIGNAADLLAHLLAEIVDTGLNATNGVTNPATDSSGSIPDRLADASGAISKRVTETIDAIADVVGSRLEIIAHLAEYAQWVKYIIN